MKLVNKNSETTIQKSKVCPNCKRFYSNGCNCLPLSKGVRLA